MKLRLILARLILLGIVGMLGACTLPISQSDSATSVTSSAGPSLFSGAPLGALPSGWEPILITRQKRPTKYQLVTQNGVTRRHAQADGASSLLMHSLAVDPQQWRWLNWQWKVDHLLAGADNHYRASEDAPARIVLAFDGDKARLPFTDQIMFETGKIVSGNEMPYATLMYIWENKAPVGSVIAHTRTGRVKMIVAASGSSGPGRWQALTRNIAADYQRAFGEPAGRLIGVGIMTDGDNTGQFAEAWYGDIRLLP